MNERSWLIVGKILVVLLVSLVFGIIMQALKGEAAGIRYAIGNLSIPWILLPYFAGRVGGHRHLVVSAFVGLTASLIALVGFYATDPLVWHFAHKPYWVHQGIMAYIQLTLVFGKRWFLMGIVSGSLFGVLGSFRSRRLAITIPILIMLEPVAHVLWIVAPHIRPVVVRGGFTVWSLEFITGVVAMIILARGRRRM